MPLTVLPDPETVTIQALAAQTSIAAIVGTRIASEIPTAPVFPLLRVTKAASIETDIEGREVALMSVECWADTDATASLLARTVVAARKDMSATYAAGWVALVDVSGGPIPAYDPESERARWIVDLDIVIGY